MSHKNRRHRGGQIGNHNRLKHGFYSKAAATVNPEDTLQPVEYLDELDRAIAITRMTFRSLLQNDPENHKLISYSLSLLERLISTKHRISGKNNDPLREASDLLGRQLDSLSWNRGAS